MRREMWIAVVVLQMAMALAGSPALAAESKDYTKPALRVADFLLRLQNPDGAIPDSPGDAIVNEDSNMEYALMGLAAAYWRSKDVRYLQGLEKGIRWLAAREETTDPDWQGSWFLGYASKPPYSPVPISPGPRVADARGVDATSALFVYLLRLHSVLSGTDALAKEYETKAKAALDFVLNRNGSPDGFSYSSWQKKKADGQWRLWRYQYAADQADVFLGLRAGGLLYGDPRYQQSASQLQERTPARFFDPSLKRLALGRDKDGSLDSEFDEFDGIFPQGYVPWAMGKSEPSQAAFRWLSSCRQPDGSIVCYPGDPKYSLSAAILALAASALGEPAPTDALDWLVAHAIDSRDGAVRDTIAPDSAKYSNVAGFVTLALLQFPAFPGSSNSAS